MTPKATTSSSRAQSGNFSRLAAPHYFKELSHIPTLEPEQEFDLAKQLEDRELALWDRLLSLPAVLRVLQPRIRQHLQAHHDDKGAELLEAMARASARRSRSQDASPPSHAAPRRRGSTARSELAQHLRVQDPDRQLLDSLLETLQQAFRPAHGRRSPRSATAGRIDIHSPVVHKFVEELHPLDSAARASRNAFVRANLRLVIAMAHRYDNGRLPFADLIQEGNIGLIKAVGRFDHRKGCRFSTYAGWWIRHSLSRALADKARMVRIPVYLQARHHRISRAQIELSNKLGRAPTDDEVSASADISSTAVLGLRNTAPGEAVSLDRPVSEEDGRSFVDLLVDEESAAPGERLVSEESLSQVRRLLGELPAMEADILRQRFGLADGREHTLKEIGRQYNLCRERIRQIQQKALARMRDQMD